MTKDYASAGCDGVNSAFCTRQFVDGGAGILEVLGLDAVLPHAGMAAVGS
jgi:hypothetical protein